MLDHRADVRQAATDDIPELPPDPWFNPYRQPATERAWAIVRDVAGQVQSLERYRRLRTRKRKASDQASFEAIIAAVVSDLIHHHLSGSPGSGLVVPRSKRILSKRSRYRPPVFTDTFPAILDALATPELAFLEQRKGQQQDFMQPARQTTIKAAERLVGRIEKHGVAFADLTLSDAEEVILLKKPKAHYLEDRADLQEYDDNDTTRRYRGEVRAINDWLRDAEITFDADAALRAVEGEEAILVANADTTARRLRRYFSRGSFESGGRLFGGFWQNMPKQARLVALKIEGEPVISLDYSQLNPRIAYSIAGTLPAEGDAYTLRGLERQREGVKKVFNAMMFARKPLKKVPRGTRPLLPPKVSIGDVTKALMAKHPGLQHVFHTEAGHRSMWIESEIMMRVILTLKERGIVTLPVHDAVVVKASNEEIVRQVMEDNFRGRTGLSIVVRREDA